VLFRSVWDNMTKESIGIFQYESDYAFSMLKKALSKETLDKARAYYEGVSRLDIMSIVNAGIRPGGKSYINELVIGDVNDNGHEALNELLGFTFGYLVFQESIIEFLNKFCGFTLGQADLIRRGFAKKTGTEQYIPQIKEGFINTMQEQYSTTKKKAEEIVEQFLQVIVDASDYAFSLNHAMPYSMLGYALVYLRTHYPLEFLTSLMHYNQGKQEKTARVMDYIDRYTDIKVLPITYGKSKSQYFCDKATNTIYKGLTSIKDIGEGIGDELFESYNPSQENFLDVLKSLSSTSINNTQLSNLIKLDFFREYGKPKHLLGILETYDSLHSAKVINKGKYPQWESVISKHSRVTEKQYRDLDNDAIIAEIISDLPTDEEFTLKEMLNTQLQYLGYVEYTDKGINDKIFFVESMEFYKDKSKPVIQAYNIKTGKRLKLKITKANVFLSSKFKQGDFLVINSVERRGKRELVDGQWQKSKTEFDLILNEYQAY